MTGDKVFPSQIESLLVGLPECGPYYALVMRYEGSLARCMWWWRPRPPKASGTLFPRSNFGTSGVPEVRRGGAGDPVVCFFLDMGPERI